MRWTDDVLRLLIAMAFLLAAKALLRETSLWDALRAAGGATMLLLGMLLVGDVLTRWLGLRKGSGPRTGAGP